MGKFKTVAIWPESVKGLGTHDNSSSDIHSSLEQAEAVARGLRGYGFGGEEQIFPLEVYVEEIPDEPDATSPQSNIR